MVAGGSIMWLFRFLISLKGQGMRTTPSSSIKAGQRPRTRGAKAPDGTPNQWRKQRAPSAVYSVGCSLWWHAMYRQLLESAGFLKAGHVWYVPMIFMESVPTFLVHGRSGRTSAGTGIETAVTFSTCDAGASTRTMSSFLSP